MKWIKIVTLSAWLLISSAALTRWWFMNPEYFFPLPATVWEWLGNLYGTRCCEEQADLELLVGFVAAFITVSLVTLAGVTLYRRASGAR